MYILLNIINQGSSAILHCRANKKEPSFQNNNEVKIAHTSDAPSLRFEPFPKRQHDNDHFITFKSTVPFKTFCEQFSVSEYNDPEHYQMLFHNCANTVHFALQLAGINISLSYLQFGRWFEYSQIIRIPGTTLTPLTLYEAAKTYKSMLQSQNGNPLASRWRIISEELTHQLDVDSRPKVREMGQVILSEAARHSQSSRHHIEHNINMLRATRELLDSSTPDNITCYQQQISFFKNRTKPLDAFWAGRFIDGLTGIVLLQTTMRIAQLDPVWFNALELFSYFLFALSIYSIISEKIHTDNSRQRETLLSKAMTELTAALTDCRANVDRPKFVSHQEY